MASLQRSTFILSASVSSASAAVPSDPYETPKGMAGGGVQVVIALGTGGDFDGGEVGAVLQGTNQSNAAGDAIASSPSWEEVPGGTINNAAVAQAAFLGDGNLVVDVSPYRWLRLLPVVDTAGGNPINITVSAYGKFDYDKG